jgi:predicted metal-dependent peptidase
MMAKEKKTKAEEISKKEQDFLLAAIRVKASKLRPYYSPAIFATIPMPKSIGTFAIDKHWRLYYDPVTLKEWGIEKAAGVLIHEINHVLRSHFKRTEMRSATNFMLANIAQDLEINDDLIEDNIPLPKDVLLPKAFGLPNGKVWEEYYQTLYDNADKYEICDGSCGEGNENDGKSGESSKGKMHIHIKSCGSGAHNHKDEYEESDSVGDKISPAEQEAIKRAVASEIQEYAKKTRGTVPAGLKRWADTYLDPKVPWFKELRVSLRKGIADAMGMVDFSYGRVSRRQATQPDMILPGFRKPSPSVGVIIDTSGSMGTKELVRALAEIRSILKTTGRIKDTLVLTVDADVHFAKKIVNPKQIELLGGGGTDMTKGFTYIDKLRRKPDVVVLITDGYTPFPSKPTSYKTICLVVGEGGTELKSQIPTWMKQIFVAD